MSQAPNKQAIITSSIILILLNLFSFLLLQTPTAQQWLHSLGNYNYFGAFLVSLIGNATVIIPVPYVAIIMALAQQSSKPILLVLAGALGSTLGESIAYWLGRSGQTIIADTALYRWLHPKLQKPWQAILILFILAAPPNPAFDIAGLSAGALGLPYRYFFIAVFLGRIIRITIFVITGQQLS